MCPFSLALFPYYCIFRPGNLFGYRGERWRRIDGSGREEEVIHFLFACLQRRHTVSFHWQRSVTSTSPQWAVLHPCGLIHFHNGLNNCFCLSPLLIEGFQMKCGHLLQKYLPSVTNINRQNKQISAGCFIDIHITQTQTHTKSSPVQTNTRQISQRGWLKTLIASKNSSIVAWEHMENKRLVLPQYSTCKAEKKLMTH